MWNPGRYCSFCYSVWSPGWFCHSSWGTGWFYNSVWSTGWFGYSFLGTGSFSYSVWGTGWFCHSVWSPGWFCQSVWGTGSFCHSVWGTGWFCFLFEVQGASVILFEVHNVSVIVVGTGWFGYFVWGTGWFDYSVWSQSGSFVILNRHHTLLVQKYLHFTLCLVTLVSFILFTWNVMTLSPPKNYQILVINTHIMVCMIIKYHGSLWTNNIRQRFVHKTPWVISDTQHTGKVHSFINPFTATLPRMLTLPAPGIFTVSTLRSGYYL